MITNYHTHCYLDDGRERPEEYVRQALNDGFHSLGFSCHAPLPYPNEWALQEEGLSTYLTEIAELRERYREDLPIYIGIEADYIPECVSPADARYSEMGLDYIIGSVHSLLDESTQTEVSIDNTVEELKQLLHNSFKDDIRLLCENYFAREEEMIVGGGLDIVGHCDLLRKLNRGNQFFDPHSGWYIEMAESVLDATARMNLIVEVNTGGIARGYMDEFYPERELLKMAKIKGIPIVLSSDAHSPGALSAEFETSREIIRSSGYSSLMYLDGGVWKDGPL